MTGDVWALAATCGAAGCGSGSVSRTGCVPVSGPLFSGSVGRYLGAFFAFFFSCFSFVESFGLLCFLSFSTPLAMRGLPFHEAYASNDGGVTFPVAVHFSSHLRTSGAPPLYCDEAAEGSGEVLYLEQLHRSSAPEKAAVRWWRTPIGPGLRGTAILFAFLAVLVAPTHPRSARAEPRAAPADEVKAAFLYNFGKFVVWPGASPRPEATFVIGVLGDSPMAEVLDRTVRAKQVQERRIAVRRLRSAKEAQDCQILFIGAAERDRLGEILGALDRRSVLTVSDMDEFVDKGGMISLLLDQNKVRFEINLGVVDRAGLKMSSQLLKLARRVIGLPG